MKCLSKHTLRRTLYTSVVDNGKKEVKLVNQKGIESSDGSKFNLTPIIETDFYNWAQRGVIVFEFFLFSSSSKYKFLFFIENESQGMFYLFIFHNTLHTAFLKY
jgi:hypothetical protein